MKRPAAVDPLPTGIREHRGGYEVRHHGYVGFTSSIKKAKVMLATEVGCQPNQLQHKADRVDGAPDQQTRWSWVPTGWRYIMTRSGKYRVQVGNEYVGTFGVLRSAFEALAEYGAPAAKKPDPDHEMGVFKIIFPLFKDWMPVDYHTHLEMDAQLKRKPVPSCIYVMMMVGKEREWREHLTTQLLGMTDRQRVVLQGLLSMHQDTAETAGKLVRGANPPVLRAHGGDLVE